MSPPDAYDFAHAASWGVVALAALLLFAGLEFVAMGRTDKPGLRWSLALTAYALGVYLLWVAYQLAGA